jgi:hypothetical protein
MNIEQRLSRALQHVDDVDPSPDLWARVVHSIDEERRHRRRLITTTATIFTALAAVVVAAVFALDTNEHGRYIDRPTLEVLEAVVLCVVALALGPAIRKFGRGFTNDLWPTGSPVPGGLLRLLDVAYYLVLAGYILLSTEFHFGADWSAETLANQLHDSAGRLGGLFLIVGLLHAHTIAALPFVALIDNSTRAGKPLPRWMILLGVIVAILMLPVIPALVAGLIANS